MTPLVGRDAALVAVGVDRATWYRRHRRSPQPVRLPQLLEPEENLAVLARLVANFEREVENPMLLDLDWGRPVAQGTVGIRLPITRFVCKIKMSQDKDPVTQEQVMAALRAPGPFQNPELADDMARTLSRD
jgi:transcriptional regulator